MRRIIGAYHVAMFPGWRNLVRVQCRRMNDSGLLDRTSRLLVGVVGDSPEDLAVFTDLLGSKAVVRYLGPLVAYEFPTLQWLYEEVRLDNVACWYAHTKGIFDRSDLRVKWRLKLESVVFDQHEKCLDALETHDTCGTGWLLEGNGARNPHYSGNFWWANSSYLKTLPPPSTRRLGKHGRWEAEFWIGKNFKIRPFNLDAPPQLFDKPSAWVGLESKYRELIGAIGPVQRIVDLGVDYGFSTFYFAMHYPDAEVVGVSDFKLHEDSEEWVQRHAVYFPNVKIIKGSTANVGNSFGDPVDLLHIDADHAYESVAMDFQAWFPAVRPGGRVLFHDTVTYETVGRFFNKLEGEKSEILEHHGLGCWIKPLESEV